jgi:hypothetical protein
MFSFEVSPNFSFAEVFSIRFVGGDIVVADDFPVHVPAAIWLFASGLLGLLGMGCKRLD